MTISTTKDTDVKSSQRLNCKEAQFLCVFVVRVKSSQGLNCKEAQFVCVKEHD